MLPSSALHAAAQRWLRALHAEAGVAGLSAAVAIPGLGAMLDQHAAAVRDATSIGDASAGIVGLVLLASYGDGVYTYARDHGWRPLPAHPLRVARGGLDQSPVGGGVLAGCRSLSVLTNRRTVVAPAETAVVGMNSPASRHHAVCTTVSATAVLLMRCT